MRYSLQRPRRQSRRRTISARHGVGRPATRKQDAGGAPSASLVEAWHRVWGSRRMAQRASAPSAQDLRPNFVQGWPLIKNRAPSGRSLNRYGVISSIVRALFCGNTSDRAVGHVSVRKRCKDTIQAACYQWVRGALLVLPVAEWCAAGLCRVTGWCRRRLRMAWPAVSAHGTILVCLLPFGVVTATVQ